MSGTGTCFIGLFSAIRNIVARGGRFVRIRNIAKPDYLLTPGVTVVVACAASPGPNIAGHNRMLLIIFPVVLTLFFLSYNSAGIGLYWSAATGNIFMEFEFILT